MCLLINFDFIDFQLVKKMSNSPVRLNFFDSHTKVIDGTGSMDRQFALLLRALRWGPFRTIYLRHIEVLVYVNYC